jgi:hypothetical protein
MGNWFHNGEIHHGSSRVSTAHDLIQAHVARRTIVFVVMRSDRIAGAARAFGGAGFSSCDTPESHNRRWVSLPGFPAWLRVQHFLA